MSGFDPTFQMQSQTRAMAAQQMGKDYAPGDEDSGEDLELHAGGEICARCERTITATQDVRKNASGAWVHLNC